MTNEELNWLEEVEAENAQLRRDRKALLVAIWILAGSITLMMAWKALASP
jgi:hypothetical protein